MNWDSIDLVVFDVDGTLYNQSRLRVLLARDVLLDAASRLSFDTLRVIRHYRRIREQLAEGEVAPFEAVLTAETASRTGHSVEEIQSIAKEWLERRPLPYLASCRYRGLDKLFAALRDRGKAIGILSDYPRVRSFPPLASTPTMSSVRAMRASGFSSRIRAACAQ